MKNKRFWLGILVMALVFGMTVVGCDDSLKEEPNPFNDLGVINMEWGGTLSFGSDTWKRYGTPWNPSNPDSGGSITYDYEGIYMYSGKVATMTVTRYKRSSTSTWTSYSDTWSAILNNDGSFRDLDYGTRWLDQ
jgi:hypothetical protein